MLLFRFGRGTVARFKLLEIFNTRVQICVFKQHTHTVLTLENAEKIKGTAEENHNAELDSVAVEFFTAGEPEGSKLIAVGHKHIK